MDIELQKETVNSPARFYEPGANQSVDLEINLPDYCSDIKRILRCFVIPGISSAALTGDRASAKGDITVRLVYVGESEKVDCYEQTIALSCFSDMKELPENPVLCASAKTQYVNCRAASQRRFVVNASIAVDFEVYASKKINAAKKANSDIVETSECELKAVTDCVLNRKSFDLSETIALGEKKDPIGKIISLEAAPKIDSVKTVSGKCLIKGELECKLVYCTDTKEKQIETLLHKMPISQIVEVPGVDDSFSIDMSIGVSSSAVSLKADSSGSSRLVEFAVKLDAFLTGTKEGTVTLIEDCYSTQFECNAEYKKCEFKKRVASLDFRKSVSASVDLSSQGAKKVLDVKIIDTACSFSENGFELEGRCSVLLGIIFEDQKEHLQYVERNHDFDFSCELSEKSKKIICEPNVSIVGLGFGGSPEVSVSFDCEIKGSVYSVISRNILESITADEEKKKDVSDAAVTVYYASKGERLWDIAKRYNTRKQLILDENGIDCESLGEDSMLMIPCV